MVYATEETPLGTAGSVRNAMDELDERVPRHLRRRAHRHRPRPRSSPFHEEQEALATIGLEPVENPLEFGIVITREDGSIERFLEKPTWGQVFSDTINTGIFVLEPEIFDYIPAGPAGRLLRRGLPRRCSTTGKPALRRRGRGLLGGRRHPRGLPPGPPGRPRRQGRASTSPASSSATASGWARGPRSTPTPRSTGPAVIGDNCRVEAGARLGEYTVLGANVRVRADADLERAVVHDNAYLGEGVRLRGAVVGRSCDLRRRRPLRGGRRCSATSASSASTPSSAAGVKVYPFKTVEAGAIINSSIVWESRGARSLFGRDGRGRAGQRRHHPRAGRPGGHGLRHHPEEGRHGHHVAGLEPGGPDAQAGGDGRPQRRRRQRRRPRGGAGAGHPVPGPPARAPAAGITVRLVAGDPQSVVDPLLRRRRRRHRRGRPAQDRAALLPGGLPAGVRRPRSATSASRPGPSSTTRPPSRRPSTSAPSGRAGFKVVVDYAYGSTSFVMPNVLAKLGADVLAVNPYASTAGRRRLRPPGATPTQVADLVRGVGRPPRARSSTPTASTSPSSTTRATSSTDTSRRCWPSSRLVAGHLLRRPRSPCRWRSPRRAERIAADARRRVRVDQGVDAGPHGRGRASRGRRLRRQPATAASSSPASCPPSTPPPPSSSCSSCWPAPGCGCPRWWPALPRVHMAHETVVTPWEQKGLVMRTLVEQAKDREVVLVDGVKVLHDDGLGAGAARPRGAGHPRLGRGRRPTPRPAGWPRSTPGASARCCAEPTAVAARRVEASGR